MVICTDTSVLFSLYANDVHSGRIVAWLTSQRWPLHTLAGGHLSFDIMHVAAALVMHAKQFLTFDQNPRQLADAEGLTVPC